MGFLLAGPYSCIAALALILQNDLSIYLILKKLQLCSAVARP